MTGDAPYDAIVVGAGPAGSAAASILAGRGRRVLLLEKDHFPRPKVCGEFLSSSASASLERLGVREEVEQVAERIERGSVHLGAGRAVSFRLRAPAFGISRFRLDALLARRAGERGVECRFGLRVVSVDRNRASGFRIRAARLQREEELPARSVIGAWGRWDALDRTLERGFLARRQRYFGWSRDYLGDSQGLAGEVRLYAFPGGYCGLSRVEGGAVNLAGVVSERSRRGVSPGWEAVVAHARDANRDLDRALSSLREGPTGFLGTGPVFFTAKPSVEKGMLLVGDAAGVIDPFSGEGQSTALASGILAAEILERGLSGEISLESVLPIYAAAWRRRFGRRFGWSSAFRRIMLHPRLGGMVPAPVAARLVRFAMERLTADS